MKNMELIKIGRIISENGNQIIKIEEKFRSALTNLKGFSHLQVLWWGHLCDTPEYRSTNIIPKPYKTGPEILGIFATRSPVRPNPILLSTIFMSKLDIESGLIYSPFIDAEPESIILDIKPYNMNERVKNCTVPEWCKHWPAWYEDSASFDWKNEFNF